MSSLDLAVIGNCRVSALIDRQANIVWSCLPTPDGDPVFCNLLSPAAGAEEGRFSIELDNQTSCEQSYLGNTAILVSTLRDSSGGVLRVTDFAPRFKQFERPFRPVQLVRRIEPLGGQPRVRVRMRPRFGYGSVAPTLSYGSNHIRYVAPSQALRLTTDAPITYIADEVPFLVDTPLNFLFGADESLTAPIAMTVMEFFERTRDYWVDWVRSLSVPFEWQDAVMRAAITLKLCSFEETGAVLAALTTSLPESPDSGRNWDYRYCWLRDAYFTVQALNQLCATRTMEHFIRYITNAAAFDAAHKLRPVYTLSHSATLEEITVPDLRGYRGMGPVRKGNAAYSQIQNDSYGSVVLATAQAFFDHRLPQEGNMALFGRLEQLGEHARAVAFEPDASLWEFRGRSRVHTFSSVMCWAACDRLAKIAARLGLAERTAYWKAHAREIRTETLRRSWDARNSTLVAVLDGGEIDASLLLVHEVGFLAADDQRFVGTVEAVGRHLRRGNHLFRYTTADDFGMPKTAFTVCTFWYINALAAIGRSDDARDMFEELLSSLNHFGLLSEDIDPVSGELWGNFPQTYSMVGLILCAMRLSKSWEEAFWRGS